LCNNIEITNAKESWKRSRKFFQGQTTQEANKKLQMIEIEKLISRADNSRGMKK
jgi:hypothetical protein